MARGNRWMVTVVLCGAFAFEAGACTRGPIAEDEVRLHVDASLRVNAVYHVACRAGSIACTTEVFERFWTTRLNESPEDREDVARWRTLIAGVVQQAPAMSPAPFLTNAGPFHPGSAAKGTVIAGALETRTSVELRRLAPALSEVEARELIEIVDRVERRLRPWWDADGERSVLTRARRVEDTAKKNRMAQTMVRVARFMESDPPDRDVYVHLIAAPDPKSNDYGATAIFNHLAIEAVDAADNPDDLVHGAVHELTHYLYDYMPAAKHLALVEEFAGSGAPSASGIYSYLHEALAVSAQVVYRNALPSSDNKGESDDKEYKHPYIPVLAAVASPLVEKAIAAGGHFDRGLARQYLSAAGPALGTKLREPRFVLAQVILVTSPGAESFADMYQRTMFPVAVARYTDLRRADAFPDANVVQLSTYAELDRAPVVDASLQTLRSGCRGIAYAAARGRGGYRVVIAGFDADAIAEVIRRLGELEAFSGPGRLLKIDEP
ncbi:MAG TPA: hypothetical protein VMS54_03450 [Vicinamibacterales bacterium]|nr:hypothetical protein [Vicinamibacterales bacterium]